MVEYRSRTTTHGRNMAGARALWRATQEDRGTEAWTPVGRERHVSQALWAYAALTTSASRGAVRDLSQLKK